MAFVNLVLVWVSVSLVMFRLVVTEGFSVPLDNRAFSKMPTDCSKPSSLKGIIPKFLVGGGTGLCFGSFVLFCFLIFSYF